MFLRLVAELGCLMSGVLLTADCISREKRETTIGLLFLTDLKGHDVVLGKVVAASLHFIYALLAVLPLLGLTILLGGVTGGDYWRTVLVLLASLLFSLGLGVLVSTYSRQPRYAMGGTLLILVIVTCVLPIFNRMLPRWPLLYELNPMCAWEWADDHVYRLPQVREMFWISVALVGGLGAVFLGWASLVLPLVWQEGRGSARKLLEQEGRREAEFGSEGFRLELRRELLGVNPYYWLASRGQGARNLGWLLFGAMMLLWLCLFAGVYIAPPPMNLEAFSGVLFIAGGLNVIYKYMVAWEASRRLHEDRESGALELLMVTPLSAGQIVAGQARALWRGFWFPALTLMVAGSGLIWLVSHPHPLNLRLMRMDGSTQMILFGGAMVMVVLDFFGLAWTGMWMALRARKHHNAVLCTLALVVLLPWAASLPVWLWLGGGAGGQVADANVMVVLWFVLGGVNDLVLVLMSKAGLRREFRLLASGDPSVEPETEYEAEAAREAAAT